MEGLEVCVSRLPSGNNSELARFRDDLDPGETSTADVKEFALVFKLAIELRDAETGVFENAHGPEDIKQGGVGRK